MIAFVVHPCPHGPRSNLATQCATSGPRTILFSLDPAGPNRREKGHLHIFSLARKWCTLALIGVLTVGRVDALSLLAFVNDTKLTPKRFAANFEGFEYEFHAEVQPPDVFLSTRSGDCDDYAILADYVLKRKGFGTRLVRVSLVGRVAHDVCYLVQSKAYLDYNNRNYASTLEGSGRRLRQIATEVADSFQANWTTVTEYTYDYDTAKKQFVRTIVKTDPPARDADA